MNTEMVSDQLGDEQRLRLGVFCEGGGAIGFGHVTRCSALIQESLRRGIRCSLIVDDQGLPPALLAESSLGATEIFRFSWATDPELCARIITDNDFIVVDSYHTTPQVRASFCANDQLSLFIDDQRMIEYPDGAVILNSSPDARERDYEHLAASSLLLGPGFAPLRGPFERVESYSVTEDLRSLLVTTGGAIGPERLRPLLFAIREAFPEISVNLIPPSSSHILAQRALFESFSEASLAITGGGQSLIELLRLGVPTISICLAENQRQNILGFARAGATLAAGNLDDSWLVPSILELISRCKDAPVRESLSMAALRAVDGLGAIRTIDFLLRELIRRHLEIRTACALDSRAVLALSNLDSVRRVSHRTSVITPDEHEAWYRKRLEDRQTIFLVAICKARLLGQFRLECKDQSALVSASVHPSVRGMGIGSRLMATGLEMLRRDFPDVRRVVGHPKLDNSVSQHYIEKAGFIRKGKQNIAGEEVFYYECPL